MIQNIEFQTTDGILRATREGATLNGKPIRITRVAPLGGELKRCTIYADGWSADAPTRHVEIALALLADGKNGNPEARLILARLVLLA